MYNAVRGEQLTYDIFNAAYPRNVRPDTAYTRQWGVDLVSRASWKRGEGRVDPSELWVLNGNETKFRPLVNSDLLVTNSKPAE